MRIDEKVRDAHLEHFCPGGLGLAVTTSRPAWPVQPGDAPAGLDGNAARAAGQLYGAAASPWRRGRTSAGASAGPGCTRAARPESGRHAGGQSLATRVSTS
jgi:hypothetical protein